MHCEPFSTADDAKKFILAGNARITLVSQKTGQRFSYRVRRPDENKPHFVQLLSGPDNESSYTFLGTIFESKNYRNGRNISGEAPSARAFDWTWRWLLKGEMPPHCEIWHEGRCGRCGRVLTVPDSIRNGLGPDCAGKV